MSKINIKKKLDAFKAVKSVKMGADELGEKIKAAVKEAMSEGGDDTGEDSGDVKELIKEAVDAANAKRKSRKDDGEDVEGELTTDEIMEAVEEILGGGSEDEDGEKADGEDDETPEDGGSADDESKSQKSHGMNSAQAGVHSAVRETKSANQANQPSKATKANPKVNRKYSNIFLTVNSDKKTEQKQIPAAIQLARAIKCLDVFGRGDPDAAACHAEKKYADTDMVRQFKALNATSPTSGGYLIPEIYLGTVKK